MPATPLFYGTTSRLPLKRPASMPCGILCDIYFIDDAITFFDKFFEGIITLLGIMGSANLIVKIRIIMLAFHFCNKRSPLKSLLSPPEM
jgi:hypothetical protein